MNLVAIALLCQVFVGDVYRPTAKKEQLECQKYYVGCWKKKRADQIFNGRAYDGEAFLAECVLERTDK